MLLLRQGDTGAAANMFREAVDIARQQRARLWELRAALSLAQGDRDQVLHMEAVELLRTVYGGFTEGFGTLDLAQARALLSSTADAKRIRAADEAAPRTVNSRGASGKVTGKKGRSIGAKRAP